MSTLTQFFPSGSQKVWVTGMTVEQGGVVLSPGANLKPYIRTAATGGGTTDPALDSATYRAVAERPVRSLYGNESTVASDQPVIAVSAPFLCRNNVRQTLSGALTAATYKSILTVSGGGTLRFAAMGVVNPTARTASLRIVIDGVTAFERSVAFTGTPNKSIVGVGQVDFDADPRFSDVRFASSLSVDVKSSLTETDVLYVLCNYEVD